MAYTGRNMLWTKSSTCTYLLNGAETFLKR